MRIAALLEGARLAKTIPTESPACPICDGDSFEALAHQDRYGMGIVTAICRGCGLIMSNPRPTQPFLDEFYRDLYRPFYRRVATPTAADISKHRIEQRAIYTVERLRTLGKLRDNASVLDLGCGDGSLLRAVQGSFAGLTCWGVEPGSKFATFAGKHAACTVVPSTSDIPSTTRFDLATMFHVLEHIPDPVVYLRSIKPLLTPSGMLFIDVPDVERYSSIADLHIAHIYHFSRHTLPALVERAGYKVEELSRHTPPSHPPSLTCIARPAETDAPATKLQSRLGQDVVRHIGERPRRQLARIYLLDPILKRIRGRRDVRVD